MRLIDANVLKDAIIAMDYLSEANLNFICKAIDNAPTVESDYEWGYSEGVHDTERPQGEWITDDPTYSTWRCNKCLHVQTICSNFCPNCGADMRQEGKNEV